MTVVELPMHIGGEARRSGAPQTIQLPYDGSPVATVFRGTPADVEAAVNAATAAAPVMREMTREERSAILRRVYQMMLERRDALAWAVMSESGKPIREARLEVERASQTVLFASEEAHRLVGEVVPMDASPAGKGRWGMTVREPRGVIAAITPFNFPLNLSMHKIAPAIASGNAVVHKPASTTPVSALIMAGIFEECGLPKGAINVVTGAGAELGDALVFSPGVRMVTFTGSAEVGLRIRNLAGTKKVTLELGNNSAVIIEEDAHLEEAVPRCVSGSFTHSGQVCISVQRIYVQRKVRDEFIDRFVDATRKLVIGHPQDPTTDISSLITPAEAERIANWLEEAKQAGARLLTGGRRRERATVEPAVFVDVPDHVSISCREAFGPVVGINAYDALEEAIDRVNRSEYGLQAGIYTRDLEKAFRAANRVQVGGFMINDVPQYRVDQMPYGGVKMSGTGREGPKYAIEEMTELKLIVWKT
jgi:acyl-CoA reductase-like NAD-dependent aldehyde dehydrogenase